WSDQKEDVRVQNKEARRILIELEALAQSTSAGTRFARLSLDISSCLSGSTAVSRVRL
ncbi:hypothetical protein Tco_0437432, partial [Tanacetum coccineum]